MKESEPAETKDVESSTAELEALPVKRAGRSKKDAKKEEVAKSDPEDLAQTKPKRGAKSKSAKSDTEEMVPEQQELPKKRSARGNYFIFNYKSIKIRF